MGIRIICSNCKTVLYDGKELVSPREIIDKYDSICPKCSSFLTFDPSRMNISINDKPQRSLLKFKPF